MRSAAVQTGPDGKFVLDVPAAGALIVRVESPGFAPHVQTVRVEGGVHPGLAITLQVAEQRQTVVVESDTTQAVNNPVAIQSVSREALESLPDSPGSGLNDAILFSAPGVAADSNGFFHPMGDHSQVSFVIDGQPIGDQRNKVFSTSIPLNAVQSMEIISGSPQAEFGDKTSLVVNTRTRSGLNQSPHGSLLLHYGSFGTIGEEATHAWGGARFGNFAAINVERTGRFLDTPEFRPIHAIGNTGTLFDRIDYQPDQRNTFHLSLLAARNWMQIPNTYDQPLQDQRQKVVSFNIAPGYERTLHPNAILTANVFIRRDSVQYYPTRDNLHDLPATVSQNRSLLNVGARPLLAVIRGRHSWKFGTQAMRTSLDEKFTIGITDGSLAAQEPFLQQFDLRRGGKPYQFAGKVDVDQSAAFAQDTVTLDRFTLSLGFRADWYRGLTHGYGMQPRAGVSYRLPLTGTVLRAAYSRTLETPVNENLVVSSATGPGGLAGTLYGGTATQQPIPLGRRNQFDAGIEQAIGPKLIVTIDYFRKYTRNAYDFNALLSTPITFPIGWAQSKLDGIAARISTKTFFGFQIAATMGHANARFFGPETGGVIFNSDLAIGAYRQDHDQVYQQNLNVRYQPNGGRWLANLTWRFDSGLVVGAVNDLRDALDLTAAQQSAIGLYCGPERASLSHRIAACGSGSYGAERIHILPDGAENDDHNPPRAKARHVIDISAGTSNLFKADKLKTSLRVSVQNLTNVAALYNFLSPFSGTHWIAPRMLQVQLGWNY